MSRSGPGASNRSVSLEIILFSAILKYFSKTLYNIKYFPSTVQLLFKNIL